MLARIREQTAKFLQRIPQEVKDRLRVALWWLATIGSFYPIAHMIFSLTDPGQVPLAGAAVTVFAFFSFTRLKSRQDSWAQEAEANLLTLIAQNSDLELNQLKRAIEAERYERQLECYRIRKELSKLSNQGVTSSWSISGSGRDSLPSRPFHLNSPVTRISNYDQLFTEYKKSIRTHREWASRYGTLEMIAILYGAAISGFGTEFVTWWNG